MGDDQIVEINFSTKNKMLILLFFFCILLCGFILGFAISGNIVQSNWEIFYEEVKAHYERDCTCIKRNANPYAPRRPTDDWKNEVWATLDFDEINISKDQSP